MMLFLFEVNRLENKMKNQTVLFYLRTKKRVKFKLFWYAFSILTIHIDMYDFLQTSTNTIASCAHVIALVSIGYIVHGK